MKQSILIILTLCLLPWSLFCDDEAIAVAGDDQFISQTYSLSYITSEQVIKMLGRYIIDHSPTQVLNVITVRLLKKDQPEFEFQLRQIDIPHNRERGLLGKLIALPRKLLGLDQELPLPKPSTDLLIQFRIYTVLASRDFKPSNFDNPELERVVAELNNVLNFKSYQADGTALAQVRNYSERNFVKLASRTADLSMQLDQIAVGHSADGRRVVEIGQLEVRDAKGVVISTKTSINENGFLVVGITPLGGSGDSLAIILNVEIR